MLVYMLIVTLIFTFFNSLKKNVLIVLIITAAPLFTFCLNDLFQLLSL